jgi:hypothetical protein
MQYRARCVAAAQLSHSHQNDIAGWTPQLRDRQISRLAR